MCAEERIDERSRPHFRWVEAIALAIVTFIAAYLLIVFGPFDESETSEEERAQAHQGHRAITIAVAPLMGVKVTHRELVPVAAYLSRTLSMDVDLSPSKTTEEALDRLVNNSTEVALLPALACVQAKERDKGIKLLVAQSFEHTTSADQLLVGRRSDESTELDTLQGRDLCFADQSSTPYLLARAWIRSHGHDPSTFFAHHRPCGTELEALRRLSNGSADCDVAAISAPTLKVSSEFGISSEHLEIVGRTGHVPLACWAAASRLDERISFNLVQALVSFEAQSATGAPMVGKSLRITVFRDVRSTTFRAVRIAAQLENWLELPETHSAR